eukprot:scaffold2657_cov89-Amphora_coffeaeformis.AAC.17
MKKHESWEDGRESRRGGDINAGDPALQALLEDEVASYRATATEEPLRGSHRKTQSLWEIPTGGPKKKGRHHRHKSSISELFHSMSSGLESIAEDVMVEARLVHRSWKEEMHDAQIGKTYFFDMNMTRSLSVLPEELPQLLEETTGVHVDVHAEEQPPPASKFGPFLALLGAVLAVSSNGSALSLLHGVEPPLKLYWRMTATSMVLCAFAVRTMIKNGGWPKLSFSQWLTFAGATIGYTGHGLLYIYALQYTSIGNVVIGANSQAILLILAKLIMGEKVLAMELGGVTLAFTGCILCSSDEAKDPDNGESANMAVVGDLLALASGAFGVGYLTFAKAVRKDLPVTGFVRAMQYFDNIIIAVATLLEPLIATMIAVAIGVGELPGPLGWGGNVLVVLGTLGVVYPSIDKPMEH